MKISIINGTQVALTTHNHDGVETVASVKPGTTKAQVLAALKGREVKPGVPNASAARREAVRAGLAAAGLLA